MHVVIFFINIGSYHAARLDTTYSACLQKGWDFTAVQVTNNTLEHKWGDLKSLEILPVKTLLPQTSNYTEEKAAVLVPAFLNYLQPDIIFIPGWGFPVSRAILSWCQRHKIPAIAMSETKWDDEKRWWWKEKLKFWLYISKFDAALVGGRLHREYLLGLGFPSDRIFLGYDTVDNDYFARCTEIARRNPSAARQRQPEIPTKPYFIVVTRLLERKNVIRLIKSYASYRNKIGGEEAWDLVICGNGVEAAKIRQLIQEEQLKNCIHLPGFVTYQAISDWYGLANAFVHPALQEQWGLVVNEACAAGLPILCSHTVGSRYELVHHGQNGFLFDPKSIPDMTLALEAIQQIDPDSRIKMGQFSQRIVENFSPRNFAKSVLEITDLVIKR